MPLQLTSWMTPIPGAALSGEIGKKLGSAGWEEKRRAGPTSSLADLAYICMNSIEHFHLREYLTFLPVRGKMDKYLRGSKDP